MISMLRRDRTLLAGFAVVAVVMIFIVIDQQHWWSLRDEYLFGYLVPVFVGWVLFERWRLFRLSLEPSARPGRNESEREWFSQLQRARGGPGQVRGVSWVDSIFTWFALAISSVGLLGVVFAALYRAMEGHNLVTTQLLGLANVLLLLGGGYLFLDRRADGSPIGWRERLQVVGLLLFPALIWLLSAPLFHFIDSSIRNFLQEQVAIAVFHIFDFLGFSIVREGNNLVLPTGVVGVAEACSGIRSLMASLFAGSFLAAACLPAGLSGLWKKVTMVLMAMAFTFVFNIGRSLFLTSWAYRHDPEAIDEKVFFIGIDLGSLHDFLGFAVIVPVVLALLALLPIFNFKLEQPAH